MAALTALTLGLSALGTALDIKNQRSQAKAIATQGGYERAQYERNALIADQQATDASVRGEQAVQNRVAQGNQFRGTQRAALASQGIDVNSGSSSDITSQTDQLTAIDAKTLRMNAAREAWGFTNEATDLRAQGVLAQMGANNQARALRAQALPTILQGASNLAGIYGSRPQPAKPLGTGMGTTSYTPFVGSTF